MKNFLQVLAKEKKLKCPLATFGIVPCCLWAYLASQDWWLHVLQTTWDDKQWLECFHMTQATFQELLDQLHPQLEQQATTMQPPLPTDTRPAIALVKLATHANVCHVGHLFSVDRATARKADMEVYSVF
ncbi:hypothetical protein Y1Q_0004856 [Alligator mississippiensis]|uniref:Uncharacterized protein n=1 Tax=Alligator mississippiensis TaxID=8496 RepID=A0A151NRX9_ALLMI|nr:hypothetical protein Y1Q_0004856 [Alligator mississippiensis]